MGVGGINCRFIVILYLKQSYFYFQFQDKPLTWGGDGGGGVNHFQISNLDKFFYPTEG